MLSYIVQIIVYVAYNLHVVRSTCSKNTLIILSKSLFKTTCVHVQSFSQEWVLTWTPRWEETHLNTVTVHCYLLHITFQTLSHTTIMFMLSSICTSWVFDMILLIEDKTFNDIVTIVTSQCNIINRTMEFHCDVTVINSKRRHFERLSHVLGEASSCLS